MEGHPDWYTRTPIKVVYTDGAEGPTDVEIYFNHGVSDKEGPGILVSDAIFVESGNFREFISS